MKREDSLIVTEEARGERIDVFLARRRPEISRSMWKRFIMEGRVLVDGSPVKSSYKLHGNELISYTIPPPRKTEILPEPIPIEILYQDEDILVLNKTAGMVVHPAAGHNSGTIVNALLYHCKDLSGIGGEIRPGIVHRLDKGTSGCLLVAKNDAAHLFLSRQFKEGKIKKIYDAFVWGVPHLSREIIDIPIGRHPKDRKRMWINLKNGKEARTVYYLKKVYKEPISLLELDLLSGRTHQIRVHLSYLGHPVVGDEIYGGRRRIRNVSSHYLKDYLKILSRPLLHARLIEFIHPRTKKPLSFNAEWPEEMKQMERLLHK